MRRVRAGADSGVAPRAAPRAKLARALTRRRPRALLPPPGPCAAAAPPPAQTRFVGADPNMPAIALIDRGGALRARACLQRRGQEGAPPAWAPTHSRNRADARARAARAHRPGGRAGVRVHHQGAARAAGWRRGGACVRMRANARAPNCKRRYRGRGARHVSCAEAPAPAPRRQVLIVDNREESLITMDAGADDDSQRCAHTHTRCVRTHLSPNRTTARSRATRRACACDAARRRRSRCRARWCSSLPAAH